MCAALVGATCAGTDARWSGEDALRFQWSLFGRVLWEGSRAEFVAAIEVWTPWLVVGGLLLSLSVGFAAARRLGRKGMLVGLLFALVVWFSVDPANLKFLATRDPGSAVRYLDLGDVVRALGWGLAALALFAWFARERAAGASEPGAPDAAGDKRIVVLACALAGLVPLALSHFALSGQPLTNDGAAYRFQAELFAQGELSHPVGELSDFFPARQVMPGARAFSKYPPGHSAVLALGELVGAPWLLPALLAALVPLWTWLLARRLGVRAPHRAAMLVSVSPAFLGVESLWLSHATSVPMCLLFAYAVLAAEDELAVRRNRALVWGLVGGLAISIAFAARPLTAVAVALPLLLHFLCKAGAGRWLVSATALVGFLPVAAGFLWVNQQLTGSAWQTAYGLYAAAVSPNDRWGLSNLGTALDYTRFNLARLSVWMHGFAPGLWLVVVGLSGATRPRRAQLLWLPALSLLAFYALHRFHGIPWVGPLYLAEAVALLAVLAALGWSELELRWGCSATRALFGVLVLASAQLLANHFVLASAHVAERQLPARLAAESGIESGVIFVPLKTEAARRRFSLPPPLAKDGLIFARDLGERNAALLGELGNPKAWILDLDRGELLALPR